MRLRAIAFLFLLFSFPTSVGALTLGPEVEMTERLVDAGDGTTTHRAVASRDGLFYVVWSGPQALMLDIFDSDGNPLEERALVANVTPDEAVIVELGSRLVVFWSDAAATRISALAEDGSLVTPGGIVLGGRGSGLDIATSADRCLVIWRNGLTLRGAILDHDLQVISTVYNSDFPANAIRAASDGQGFLLTWTGVYLSPGLFARPVGQDGKLGVPVVVDADPQESSPSIVWNGTHYLVASAVQSGLRMTLVDREAKPTGTPVLAWAREHVTRSTLWPHLYGFMVVAEDWVPTSGIPEAPQPTRLYSFLVSRTGSQFSEPAPVATVQAVNTLPSVASNGTSYFTTWNYSARGDDHAARGTIIRSNGEVLLPDGPIPGVAVSHGIRSQSRALVARGNHLFLALWVDSVRERNEASLRIARLDRDGRSLDGAGIEIHRSTLDPLPSFACGTARCLAAYQVPTGEPQTYALLGRWISRDGRSISDPFTIAPDYLFDYSASLASDGENFATVVQGVLHVVRPDQTVATTPVPGGGDTPSRKYLIASTGNGFALFWSDDAVRCVRFDRDGLVTNATTVLSTPQTSMAVGASGSEYLLVTDRLSGQRISEIGVPIGGLFNIAASQGYEPAVAWNGSSWIVTWSLHDAYGRATEMYLTPVSPAGIPGSRTLVTTSAGRARAAGSTSGPSMLLFPVTLNADVYGTVTRIHARAVDSQLETPPRRHGVRRP